ncbi:hypothetical protein A3G56_00380 [Candidatus Falkowbacteria bacterium RIFCSPLOWO2_12_FULL_45_10]|uniref:Lactamase n=3 Tax=Candidatus Falkowiibacteriota TaxID=1752728 RepID=A0A1F5RYM5_9BACT|nr:MAG: hypothetical protein A3G56_00380 [Candidatus Falkowbacteria bacterium RIFCSPLOWO2_12_FULL_45_10]OGF19500.1 MAG: hypothetical protein A3I35_01395 [Candidatus Falkowbacteria bacterium RIFCSPLOWO2_02_FULL_45_15]OGF19537.1 MAG: hypothetical protein A3D54_02165 [Candidatus Falkowbacteria bacterium RIFCSPHIGHO2_02_FULL_45_15]
MYIQYLGHSCFKLSGKDSKGENVNVIIDPFGEDYGLKVPGMEADIVTVSHPHKDHNNLAAVRGNPYVVDTAGEYEIKDVFIQGIDSFHDDKEGKERGGNIIYRLSMEDVVITHLGDLGQILDHKQVERLEGTDVLMIPVGGKYTLDAKRAVEVINQIEPRLIIPMHYKQPNLTLDISGVEPFIKEIGIKPQNIEDKLKINKKDLPTEDMELVVFK